MQTGELHVVLFTIVFVQRLALCLQACGCAVGQLDTEPLQYHNYSWNVEMPHNPQQKAAWGEHTAYGCDVLRVSFDAVFLQKCSQVV
jgi:hypothetical protein